MHRVLLYSFLILSCLSARGQLPEGRVIKVLPLWLDHKGRHVLLPSLYERDAYQAYLQAHPDLVSGRRFAVQWKAKGEGNAPLRLKLELRGVAHGTLAREIQIETFVKPGGRLGKWAFLELAGEDYQAFGKVTAWRVTLWASGPWTEETLLGEQRSFLW